MSKKLIIELDDEHEILEILEEVKKQIENGYKSGINPKWEIKDKKSSGFKSI